MALVAARRRATFMERSRLSLSLSASPVLRSPRLSAITFSRGGGMNYEGSPLARRLLLNKESRSRLCDNVDRDCDPPNNVMRAISRRASRTRTTRSHNPKREHSNVACRVLLQNIARKQIFFYAAIFVPRGAINTTSNSSSHSEYSYVGWKRKGKFDLSVTNPRRLLRVLGCFISRENAYFNFGRVNFAY